MKSITALLALSVLFPLVSCTQKGGDGPTVPMAESAPAPEGTTTTAANAPADEMSKKEDATGAAPAAPSGGPAPAGAPASPATASTQP